MAFTTVERVTGMFPSFTTGAAQKPSSDHVQTYIDDVEGELKAILVRRFSESIAEAPANGSLDLWIGNLDPLAKAVLEKICRYGAAGQLADVLATFGSKSTKDLAAKWDEMFRAMRDALDARDADGKALLSGAYDKFFDQKARVQSPREAVFVSPGSDRPKGEIASDLGLNMPFSMDEVI